jgi:hypothetical protein
VAVARRALASVPPVAATVSRDGALTSLRSVAHGTATVIEFCCLVLIGAIVVVRCQHTITPTSTSTLYAAAAAPPSAMVVVTPRGDY